MILVLYNIILITNFKLIEMCIKSSPMGEGSGEGPVGSVGLVGPVWPFIPPLVLHLPSLSFLFPPFLSLSSSPDYPRPPAALSKPYELAPSRSR